MIGQAISSCEPIPRRWLVRFWGYPDVHTRQKWMALKSALDRFPERGVRLLDAGCGSGKWALDLAARRPEWLIIGMDHDGKSVQVAESSRRKLGLSNVSFIESDFLEFKPTARFDVVLSVASAHYLVEAGKGELLFGCFKSWLKPGGRLLLIGPRRAAETPSVSWLPRPEGRLVFSFRELSRLCDRSGLTVETLCGRVGKLGTLAKQLGWAITGCLRPLMVGVYPLQVVLCIFDDRMNFRNEQPSFIWLLIARTAEEL
jgi:SAM-dependent methyltransferase